MVPALLRRARPHRLHTVIRAMHLDRLEIQNLLGLTDGTTTVRWHVKRWPDTGLTVYLITVMSCRVVWWHSGLNVGFH